MTAIGISGEINAKFLALCPLAEELSCVLTALHDLGQGHGEALSVGFLRATYFKELSLVVAQGGHGKTQFGIQAQYFLHQIPSVETLICAGCAGGLSQVQTFDVVVAEKTIEHDYELKFVKRPLPHFAGHEDGLQKLKKFYKDNLPKNFNIHFGTVASGDEDIIEKQRAEELHRQTGAIAVAWEGAGGARAAKFNRKDYLEIRGLSDSADTDAPQDFEANLPVVMNHVTQVLLKLIES